MYKFSIYQLCAKAFLALQHISLRLDKTNIHRAVLTNQKVFCFSDILSCNFLVFLLGIGDQFFLVLLFLLNGGFAWNRFSIVACFLKIPCRLWNGTIFDDFWTCYSLLVDFPQIYIAILLRCKGAEFGRFLRIVVNNEWNNRNWTSFYTLNEIICQTNKQEQK